MSEYQFETDFVTKFCHEYILRDATGSYQFLDSMCSVIFFAYPYLFKLICGSDMDMIRNNFCVFL